MSENEFTEFNKAVERFSGTIRRPFREAIEKGKQAK